MGYGCDQDLGEPPNNSTLSFFFSLKVAKLLGIRKLESSVCNAIRHVAIHFTNWFHSIWQNGLEVGDIYKGAKSKTNICTPLELFIG